MKKILLIIGAIFLLAIVGATILAPSFTELGYKKVIVTKTISTYLGEDDCIYNYSKSATPSDLRKLAVDSMKNATKDYDSVGEMELIIIPESDTLCWKVQANKTITTTEIVYTDESIVKDLKDKVYDSKDEKWKLKSKAT